MLKTTHTLQDALRALKQGKPVLFPTDTLYGLGVSVEHAEGPDVLYRIKRREKRKPIAWLVGSYEDLGYYGKGVPDFAYTLARTFWPGPLTIIVKASDNVSPLFCSAEGTIALRMPGNQTARELIEKLGCPIATTSANLSGQKNPLVFEDISEEIREQVAVALDDEESKSGIASTIVDCSSGDHLVLKREGAITIAHMKAQV